MNTHVHRGTLGKLTLVALLAALVLPSAMVFGGAEEPEYGGTLVVWMKAAPNTFIPYYSLGDYARYPGDLIYDFLFAKYPDGTFQPRLATSMTISEDGLTYTYTLNPEATWHDGNPVTANDVAFTIGLLLHPDYAGSNTGDLMPIAGAEAYNQGEADAVAGVNVIDDYTIAVTLSEVNAPFEELFGTRIWMLPEHLLGDEDPATLDSAGFAMNPVGSGPFTFGEYRRGEFIEVKRFEDYHLGKPYLDSVVIRIMDPEVAVAALETGEVDASFLYKIADIPPASVDRLERNPDVQVNLMDTDTYFIINMNHQEEYLSDPRFREALSLAIDREALVTAVERGFAAPAYGPLPAANPYHNPNLSADGYDPEQAKALLEQVGWTGDRVLVYGTPNDPRRRSIAAIVQQYLEDVGIEVSIEVYDFATLMAQANEGAFDIWNLAFGPGGIIHPNYVMYNQLHSSKWPPGWNFGWYKNERVDELLDKGARTVDRETSLEIYYEIQEIIADDRPYIYLYHTQGISAQRARPQSFVDSQVGTTYNPHLWWVKD